MRRKTEIQPVQSRYAALYIRVSTTDQGERFSPASQKKALLELAARESYTVRPEHIFEDHQTGKNDQRPAFIRLRALVKTGTVGAVFIFNVDRFARKTVDALMIAGEFKRHGVRLAFFETPFEDTYMGRFTFTQMSAIAEMIGEKIVEDSRRGRRQALEQGRITQTTPKYGYDYIPKRMKDGGRFVVNEKEASVVREIFRWCITGMTTCAIAHRLNKEGILTKGKNGAMNPGLWSRQVVIKILRSRTYTGVYSVWGIEIAIPSIVDQATWLTAQDRLKANERKNVGRPSVQALLRGLVWCRECGRRVCYKSKWSGSGRCAAYRCGNIVARTSKRVCHAPSVLASVIERAAWDAIWGALKNSDLLMRLARAYHESIAQPDSARVKSMERELTRLRSDEQTIIDMVKARMIPVREGAADQKVIRQRIAHLSDELRAAGQVISLPTLAAAKATLREITEGPEPETYEERRTVLDGILDLRMTYLAGDLEITGQIPVPHAESKVLTGSQGGNSHRRIDGSVNFAPCIPFKLKVRVA